MQYSEVNTLLDENEFIKLCIMTGKTPEEITKEIINIRRDCEVWNRCHIEYGDLMDVRCNNHDHDSYVVEVFYNGRPNKRGSSSYNCKSAFIHDGGKILEKYKSMVGSRCKFYVGYVENKDDGSVFRSLLGVDPV